METGVFMQEIKEMTIEELKEWMSTKDGEFIIQVDFGKEAEKAGGK